MCVSWPFTTAHQILSTDSILDDLGSSNADNDNDPDWAALIAEPLQDDFAVFDDTM